MFLGARTKSPNAEILECIPPSFLFLAPLSLSYLAILGFRREKKEDRGHLWLVRSRLQVRVISLSPDPPVIELSSRPLESVLQSARHYSPVRTEDFCLFLSISSKRLLCSPDLALASDVICAERRLSSENLQLHLPLETFRQSATKMAIVASYPEVRLITWRCQISE